MVFTVHVFYKTICRSLGEKSADQEIISFHHSLKIPQEQIINIRSALFSPKDRHIVIQCNNNAI